jgi:hypothetical protein
MATMAITAPTPMMTPSMVKAERMTLRPKARCAILIAVHRRIIPIPFVCP